MTARRAPPRPRVRARGFTLLSVLAAMLVLGVGLLVIARSMIGLTDSQTQNQNITSAGALSNGFWGIVQSNPSIVAASGFTGTYTSSNLASAPGALQSWLGLATGLPGGQATIATSADAASGTACAATTGCTVTLTLQWTQAASPGNPATTRGQVFYYQFGF